MIAPIPQHSPMIFARSPPPGITSLYPVRTIDDVTFSIQNTPEKTKKIAN